MIIGLPSWQEGCRCVT